MSLTVRLGTVKDIAAIETFFITPSTKYFGKFTTELFENYQTLRLVFELKSKTATTITLSFAQIRTYPNVLALPHDCWMNFLTHHYCIDLPFSQGNTLFFNSYIYKENFPGNLMERVLCEIFMRENRLRFLILIKPPEHPRNDVRMDYKVIEPYANIYNPKEYSLESCNNMTTVLVVVRDKLVPNIQFRKALPEDNDDIIELIDYEEPHLRNEFGEYFIAEELLRQDKLANLDCLIVGETIDKNSTTLTSGFVWLSEDIDLELLIESFYLEPFGNLVSLNKNKPANVTKIIALQANEVANSKLFTEYALIDMEQTFIFGGLTYPSSMSSVKSDGKIELYSQDDDIHANNSARFYEHEALFRRFHYVFEALRKPTHYVTERPKLMKVEYNLAKRNDLENITLAHARNAFLLKRFNLHPTQSLENVYYFMCATFSAYPECDYLLIMLPPNDKVSNCLNEMLKYCLCIMPRPHNCFSENLYIAHRSALCGELCLYDVVEHDLSDIQTLLENAFLNHSVDSYTSIFYKSNVDSVVEDEMRMTTIMDIMQDVLENPLTDYIFMTIRCGNMTKPREETTFLGFVIIRKMYSYYKIYKEYVLQKDEQYLEHNRAEIITLRLHPFFHVWSDELFRLLSVKMHCYDFYYITSNEHILLPNDLKTNMMPVEPRPFKKNCFDSKQTLPNLNSGNKQLRTESVKLDDRLKIFRHNLKPTRFFGNKETIVIYGFTKETKAFLRKLIFYWNGYDSDFVRNLNCVPLLNVKVIVDHGVIEAEYDAEFVCSFCLTPKECYIGVSNYGPYVRDATHRIDLRNWVQFIKGKVQHIDREKQVVLLDNQCAIYYERLLIMCQTNFGHPMYAYSGDHYPFNYSHINTRLDKIILYHKIHEMYFDDESENDILIYGGSIATFECINFLLTHGVPKHCITLVLPKINEEKTAPDPGRDSIVENIFQEMLTDMNILIYKDFNIIDWIYFDNTNFISEVNFKNEDETEILTLSCELFINFEEHHLPKFVERALQISGIFLKNSKILVNEKYQTNDAAIFALGAYVEMQTQPNYQYTYTSEMEAAEKLLHYLDLHKSDHEDIKTIAANENKNLKKSFEKRYSRAALYTAALPRNFYYYKLTMPKRTLYTTDTDNTHHCSHKVLTTYNDGDVCRIGFTNNNFVDQIVVLTKKHKKLFFLEFFCGKHETLLCNLMLRYDFGIIENFLKFFQEPWTELIMHDFFEHLQAENRDDLIKLFAKHEIDLNDENFKMNIQNQNIDFQELPRQLLEDNLIQFLRLHQNDFVNPFILPEKISKQLSY